MPLYEYECTACHRHTEKIQKFSDPEITTCPHCAGTLKRVISAPAISFKGGGWYADGYGNAKPSGDSKSGDKKADAGTSTTESKPSSGTESSTATATAPAPAAPSAPASGASSDKK